MTSVRETRASQHSAARAVAEIGVASIGASLLACAILANQRFLDRHFVPSFFLPRHWYVVLETFGRLVMVAVGTWLVAISRARAGRFAHRAPARARRVGSPRGPAVG